MTRKPPEPTGFLTTGQRRPGRELPPTPLGFKLWFAFCAVVAVGCLGLAAWLVVSLIAWLGRQP